MDQPTLTPMPTLTPAPTLTAFPTVTPWQFNASSLTAVVVNNPLIPLLYAALGVAIGVFLIVFVIGMLRRNL